MGRVDGSRETKSSFGSSGAMIEGRSGNMGEVAYDRSIQETRDCREVGTAQQRVDALRKAYREVKLKVRDLRTRRGQAPRWLGACPRLVVAEKVTIVTRLGDAWCYPIFGSTIGSSSVATNSRVL